MFSYQHWLKANKLELTGKIVWLLQGTSQEDIYTDQPWKKRLTAEKKKNKCTPVLSDQP